MAEISFPHAGLLTNNFFRRLKPSTYWLPNNSCHCPHWGYIFEGAFRFIYDDGTEEVYEEGDVFYAPSGHTAIVDRDLKFLDFSPTKEHNEVLANVGKVMSEQKK